MLLSLAEIMDTLRHGARPPALVRRVGWCGGWVGAGARNGQRAKSGKVLSPAHA